MKVLCFGSINLDYTYRVKHFVTKGETLSADSLQVFSGGKGMNQAIALSKAGADTWIAGAVGEDGKQLLGQLEEAGVCTEFVKVLRQERTGTAIIQNDAEGDNCILLYGGANRTIGAGQAEEVLGHFEEGDFLVLQNEISGMPYIMEKAHKQKMKIVLNPSPMEEALLGYPLEYVDYLILNEVEALQVLGREGKLEGAGLFHAVSERFPSAVIVLTVGAQGAYFSAGESVRHQPAYPVKAVDTTGAGDTFTGFLVGGLTRGLPIGEAMDLAAKASALAVTRNGAAPSIPELAEVEGWAL